MKFIDLINNYHDTIVGGKGDQTSPFDVDRSELLVGLFVEKEHTNNNMVAMSIAIDHLTEQPKYYTILVKSGLVDEKTALDYAEMYLKVKPNIINDNISVDKNTEDILLGFNPSNPSHYTNENFDFVAAEIENFNNPNTKNDLEKFEEYYRNWKTLDQAQKQDAFTLYKKLKMYKFDTQC